MSEISLFIIRNIKWIWWGRLRILFNLYKCTQKRETSPWTWEYATLANTWPTCRLLSFHILPHLKLQALKILSLISELWLFRTQIKGYQRYDYSFWLFSDTWLVLSAESLSSFIGILSILFYFKSLSSFCALLNFTAYKKIIFSSTSNSKYIICKIYMIRNLKWLEKKKLIANATNNNHEIYRFQHT